MNSSARTSSPARLTSVRPSSITSTLVEGAAQARSSQAESARSADDLSMVPRARSSGPMSCSSALVCTGPTLPESHVIL